MSMVWPLTLPPGALGQLNNPEFRKLEKLSSDGFWPEFSHHEWHQRKGIRLSWNTLIFSNYLEIALLSVF